MLKMQPRLIVDHNPKVGAFVKAQLVIMRRSNKFSTIWSHLPALDTELYLTAGVLIQDKIDGRLCNNLADRLNDVFHDDIMGPEAQGFLVSGHITATQVKKRLTDFEANGGMLMDLHESFEDGYQAELKRPKARAKQQMVRHLRLIK